MKHFDGGRKWWTSMGELVDLSPLDPEMYRMQAGMAMAHLFSGRLILDLHWRKRLRHLPSFLMVVGVIDDFRKRIILRCRKSATILNSSGSWAASR
jgi:hypothetical protein